MKYFYYLVSKLPIKLLYFFSDFFYVFISRFYRKKVVETNIKNSFPGLSEDQYKKIKNRFYKNFCDIFFETIKSYSIKKGDLLKFVSFKNIDVINNHISNNERVVVLTSHQCNWEWLAISAEINLISNLHFIYKKLSNSTFDEIMYKSRSRFGSILLESKDAISKLKSEINNIEVLGVVADQSPNNKNRIEWAKMLNQDTAFFDSINYIPKLTNSIVYYASMARESRGRYIVNFIKISNPKSSDKKSIIKEYAKQLEYQIIQNPGDWLWSHKRWKLTK
jgi:KDO2-lipid IV(A) lauroyltransferase